MSSFVKGPTSRSAVGLLGRTIACMESYFPPGFNAEIISSGFVYSWVMMLKRCWKRTQSSWAKAMGSPTYSTTGVLAVIFREGFKGQNDGDRRTLYVAFYHLYAFSYVMICMLSSAANELLWFVCC